jgi:hypothetical protein
MTSSHVWGTSDLLSHTLKLIDYERLMEFTFGAIRHAEATLGRVGMFTSYVLTWNIDKDGVLQIGDKEIS